MSSGKMDSVLLTLFPSSYVIRVREIKIMFRLSRASQGLSIRLCRWKNKQAMMNLPKPMCVSAMSHVADTFLVSPSISK